MPEYELSLRFEVAADLLRLADKFMKAAEISADRNVIKLGEQSIRHSASWFGFRHQWTVTLTPLKKTAPLEILKYSNWGSNVSEIQNELVQFIATYEAVKSVVPAVQKTFEREIVERLKAMP